MNDTIHRRLLIAGISGVSLTSHSMEAGAQTGIPSGGHGDTVVWPDAKDVFADVNVGVTDVSFDENETKALYGRPVSAQDIVSVKATTTKAKNLISALSAK